ncbi:MAG: tRNA preQ1(34) S-adenosylmethionine ribosyltransferase-isomerase QueA [Phycisphaerae bacterium]|nr:tRNA preQ1(34) S-adenosylmethionine ribosyltransferase-isomerase QueA [Phycisphaerae bacterium]
MFTRELQYDLPPELIAQQPTAQRGVSRLLVLDQRSGRCRHETFSRLPDMLPSGALLVLNDTRVLPARLKMHRRTGGRVEGLYIRDVSPGVWEMMVTGAGRLRAEEELFVDGSGQRLRLLDRMDRGTWQVRPEPPGEAGTILERDGFMPLPPYIQRRGKISADQAALDAERYQTVYACRLGAVAAPTAGLHFTPELLERLRTGGFEIVSVTLHVGMGTFAPIRVENLADHPMHAEWYDCPASTAAIINRAHREGRPIISVGTTSVRVLETCAAEDGTVQAGTGWTRIYIYPPRTFRVVTGMITNFHLPGSTLLALLFAFAGREHVLAAYNEAIRERYRFYSYGDAMLVYPDAVGGGKR